MTEGGEHEEVRDCGCKVGDHEVVAWCERHKLWAEAHGKLDTDGAGGAENARGLLPGRHSTSEW